MKTVTVRDLRSRFADVAESIERGESVTITRRGAPFATLGPAKVSKRGQADWASRFAERRPLGKGLSREATEKFWADMRSSSVDA